MAAAPATDPAPPRRIATTKLWDGSVIIGEPQFDKVTFYSEVLCEVPLANDGCISILMVDPDLGADRNVRTTVSAVFGYRGLRDPGGFMLLNRQRDQNHGAVIGNERALTFQSGQTYHLTFVVGTQQLSLTVDEEEITATGEPLPFERFKLQFHGWQPSNRWQVENVTVRPSQ